MEHDIHTPDAHGFIPLIHNWCDRRCEKCRFIRQCRVGIMEADLVNESRTPGAEGVESDEARLLRLMGVAPDELEQEAEEEEQESESALERALAAYRPPEPDPNEEAELAAFQRKREQQREEALNAALSRLAKAYGDLVDDWLEPRMDALTQHGITFHPRQELGVSAGLRTPEVLVLSEAFEEIGWFQHMLWVKCQRALQGRAEDMEDAFDLDTLQSDWNGTAKLCLHILQRSGAAWSTVAELLPGEAQGIAVMLEALKRCEAELHRTFPDAEKFMRPGFDGPGA